MRRKAGTLFASEVAVLRMVADGGPAYPYELARSLGQETRTTRYQLERLAAMGLMQDRWDTGPGRPGPPRRVYRLTAKGRRALRDAAPRQPLGDRRSQ